MTLVLNEKSHRYRLDGQAVPNVTTILNGGIPKPALQGWYARQAAEAAAALIYGDDGEPSAVVLDRLRRLGSASFVAACAEAPNTRRNAAAVRGTDVHHYAEQVVAGGAVDVPAEIAGHVEGYAAFADRVGLVAILTERLVASRRHWYAGRFDLIGELGGEVWALDVKTGKSIYGDTSCQVAAYARADFLVDDADGIESPLPHVDRIGALHVTESGTDLYELGDIDEAFGEFLAARRIYSTTRRRAQLVNEPWRLEVGLF